ncbi:hypothetical protein JCM10914_4009 [Paenibacillus sp. JCM 10914]|nr:hypothetical protein JCM10914_4009 [Paenibacillus sp. JCM 10914]
MNKKSRKLIASLLVVLLANLLLFECVFASLPTTPKPSNRNIHYFVGLFSYDIWRYSDGVNWTPEGYEGEKNKRMPFTYSFDIPNRKIKRVAVTKFDPTMTDPNGEDLYFYSRYKQELWVDRAPQVSYRYVPNIVGSIQGLGTESVTFIVEVIGDLDAPSPEDITRNDQNQNVRGLRYYFPMLFEIELEPEGGNASLSTIPRQVVLSEVSSQIEKKYWRRTSRTRSPIHRGMQTTPMSVIRKVRYRLLAVVPSHQAIRVGLLTTDRFRLITCIFTTKRKGRLLQTLLPLHAPHPHRVRPLTDGTWTRSSPPAS